MKSLRDTVNKIILLSTGFLIIVVCVCCVLFNRDQEIEYSVCHNNPIQNYCGTKTLSSKDEEGKKLYHNTCFACHKLDVKMTGPALRNIDSIIFKKWLTFKNKKINMKKLDNLGIDYHRNLSKKNSKTQI